MGVPTEELLRNIRIAVDLEQFKKENRDEFLPKPPHIYLDKIRQEKGLEIAEVCAKAGFDPSYCYRILSGTRVPSRNVLLHMTLAMEFDLEQTQHALRLFGLARLDVRCYRDAAIIFSVQKGYDLVQTMELLEEIGEADL